MSVEVLLMTDVEDLGKEGSVVKVADGHARNYLLPRGLAAPVTAATRRQLEKLRAERDAQRKAERKAAAELAARLSQVSVTIAVKTAGEADGARLYGSVTAADIIGKLAEQGIVLDRAALQLEHPLKELGVFDITAALYPEIQATFKVWVVEE